MEPLYSMRTLPPPLQEISQSPAKAITNQEESCPSSLEQSSHVISLLLSQQILLSQLNWGKASDHPLTQSLSQDHSLSFNWANPSVFQPAPPQYPSTKWVLSQYLSSAPSSSFQRGGVPPLPQYLSTAGPGTWYIPPDKTQDHQPIWEIWEPEEIHPNLSGFSEEVDGHKRPLLVPRLWFLVVFRWRREVCSESLCWSPKQSTDKKMHNVRFVS